MKKEVIYIAEDEFAGSYEWYPGSELISPEVQVVSEEDLPAFQEEGITFISTARLCPGSILIRNPFRKGEYIEINESEERIIRDKIGAMSKIVQQLGASHIEGEAEFLEEQRLEKTVDGHIVYKAVSLEVSYKQDQQELYSRSFKLIRDFNKPLCTKESYSEACRLLRAYNLDRDPEVRDLVEMLHPDVPNRLQRQAVRMSISREINAGKEFAASLTVLSGVFQMNLSTRENLSVKKQIIFKSEVIF